MHTALHPRHMCQEKTRRMSLYSIGDSVNASIQGIERKNRKCIKKWH